MQEILRRALHMYEDVQKCVDLIQLLKHAGTKNIEIDVVLEAYKAIEVNAGVLYILTRAEALDPGCVDRMAEQPIDPASEYTDLDQEFMNIVKGLTEEEDN